MISHTLEKKSGSLLSAIRILPQKELRHLGKQMAILNLHSWMLKSKANGPGDRFVLWFQGCSIRCPGCFNEGTHSTSPRILVPHEYVMTLIQELEGRIEGVTISGGEPTEQPDGLLALLRALRRSTPLSIVLYSGYSYDEIAASAVGRAILYHLDMLIAGPFCRELASSSGVVGSLNQEIHFLTSRYSPSDILDWSEFELVIDTQGHLTITGVQVPELTNEGSFSKI